MEFLKLILCSLLSVGAMFLIAKVMGHKQVAQLDFFDYITGITIGSIAAELATELDEPWKPLVAMVVYGAASITLSVITQRLPRLRKFINGTPTIIMDNGKIYRKNLKKAKLDLGEFMLMCREKGFFDLRDIKTAVFEHNGKLTILPRSQRRPLTPEDVGIVPIEEKIGVEVIMDGRVLGENLHRLGFDEVWLSRQLKAQGFHDAKDIFLGVYSCDGELSLYKHD